MALNRDEFSVIASFMNDYDILKTLNLVNTQSYGLLGEEDEKLARTIHEYPGNRGEKMVEAARLGYLDGVIHFYDHEYQYDAFVEACKNGQLDIAKYIMKEIKSRGQDKDKTRKLQLVNGGVYQEKPLYKRFDDLVFSTSLEHACIYGHANVVAWLLQVKGEFGNHNYKYYKSLYEKCGYDAISYGHTEVLKILLSNIPYDNDFIGKAFYQVCASGYTDMAKYMYDKKILDMSDIREGFGGACVNGHEELSKWLFSVGRIDEEKQRLTFIAVCRKGHVSIAQWLYNLGNIDKDTYDRAYEAACIMWKNRGICGWLRQIGKDYRYTTLQSGMTMVKHKLSSLF